MQEREEKWRKKRRNKLRKEQKKEKIQEESLRSDAPNNASEAKQKEEKNRFDEANIVLFRSNNKKSDYISTWPNSAWHYEFITWRLSCV